ncbi:MAG: carboxylesterase family protein [Firmicutes bacterium]|nr:carboxylesterase family protein [Bacillota bacterium]
MVKTKDGMISGIDCGSYIKYLGIPFAKAPVGELRWKAPVKNEPWDGVYEAVSVRNKAVQTEGSVPPWDKDFYDDPSFNPPTSEDCLFLHIWAPKEAKKAAVAMWIHGGGFGHGWGTEKEFDGAGYAERGVILVSIEYRMGVLGFLAHPELTKEAGVSGNYGILDQIAALDWICENIEAFGGDPENITIFGQSAGAMSVQTLVSSPLTKGKIARAILQSGGSYGIGLHGDAYMKDQEKYGLMLQEMLGADSLEEMRKVPADVILETEERLYARIREEEGRMLLPMAPIIDGYVLPESYYRLMDEGKIADVPYMVGSTKDDIGAMPDLQDKREAMLYKGSMLFSQKLEEIGRKPAYVYWFTRDLPGDLQGAWHSSELWYTMDTLDRCWRPWEEGDYQLRDRIMGYWTNFMKTGDPNGEGLPEWKPCGKEDPFVQELNV